jgi:hypothetical protein
MAIMLKLISDSGVAYTFSPTPALVISNSYEHKEDDDTMLVRTCKWAINGVLIYKAGTTLAAQVTGLKAMLEPATVKSAQLVDSYGTVLEEMPDEAGIRITDVEFPEGTGPEWATRRTFSFNVEGKEFTEDVNKDGDCKYTISYATAQSGIVTRTISGTMRDVMNKEAYAKWVAFRTKKLWDTWTNANKTDDTYKVNEPGTSCEFTLTHVQYFQAFPANVTNAELKKDEDIDQHGIKKVSLTGMLEGAIAACDTALTNILLPYAECVILKQQKSRDDYANRTSFSYEFLSKVDNPEIISSRETYTVESQVTDFVFKRVLGGGNPVKQVTSKTTAKATQSGSLKGITAAPAPAGYAFSSNNLKSRSVSKGTREYKNGENAYVYETQYSYTFEFETTPAGNW